MNNDREPLLTERFRFPVTDARHIRAVCDPTAALRAEEQAALHEDLSSVRGGAKFAQIARRLRQAVGSHHARELVTGHAGSGKSTELLRLAAELRKPDPDGKYFHVVYLDADRSLSPWNLRLPQILVALVAGLEREGRVDLKKTKSASKLSQILKGIAKATSKELARRIEEDAGIPILSAALQANQEMSAAFGTEGLQQRDRLLEHTRQLLLEVRQQLPAEVLDIAFVVDNLEKLPERIIEGESLHETLFVRELTTLDLPAHLVLTYPISLNFDSHEFGQAYRGAHRTTLPMVAVRKSPREIERVPDEAGVAALLRLIRRRVSDQLFEGEAVLREVIRLSGGCVRDVMRLLGELPIVADPPFTVQAVQQAATEFRNDYTRLLQGKPYVQHLPYIAVRGSIPPELEPRWQREVLLGQIVLEYNSEVWFDVHPLVRDTPTYKASANRATGTE